MDANTKSFRSAGSVLKKSNFLAVAITATSIACSMISLQAQEGSVSMKIDLVSWGDPIGGLSLKTAQTSSDLVAMPFQYSKAANYSGPQLMEIHKSGNGGLPPRHEATEEDKLHEAMPLLPQAIETSAAKGAAPKTALALELEKRRKESPTLVALAQLPANCRRATVLLAPGEGSTFLAYVIDDDPSKLPMGQIRIHNLCVIPVAIRINDLAPKELKTRESMVYAPPTQQCTYELAYKDGEEWKMHENNFLLVRKDEQAQMIVLKSNNQFFRAADGSTSGFLQTVTLRRGPEVPAKMPAKTGAP